MVQKKKKRFAMGFSKDDYLALSDFLPSVQEVSQLSHIKGGLAPLCSHGLHLQILLHLSLVGKKKRNETHSLFCSFFFLFFFLLLGLVSHAEAITTINDTTATI
jgi:hypothetical protein